MPSDAGAICSYPELGQHVNAADFTSTSCSIRSFTTSHESASEAAASAGAPEGAEHTSVVSQTCDEVAEAAHEEVKPDALDVAGHFSCIADVSDAVLEVTFFRISTDAPSHVEGTLSANCVTAAFW